MTSRLSWFGSAESVLRPRTEKLKEKEPVASSRHERQRGEGEHASHKRDDASHHKSRRKEGDRVTIILEEHPEHQRQRRRSTTDVSSSRNIRESKRPQASKTESAREVRQSTHREHRDDRVSEKPKGSSSEEKKTQTSSVGQERPSRRSSHSNTDRPHRSDTARKAPKPERPPLLRTDAFAPGSSRISHKTPPVSYKAAKVERVASSKASNSLPQRSASTRDRPSSKQDDRRKSSSTTSRTTSKTVRPTSHTERRATTSETLHNSSHRHSTLPRRHSTLSSLPTKSQEKHVSGASAKYQRTPAPKPERKAECLTCCDEVPVSRITKLPCSHKLCNTCMRRLFKMSLTDPQQMPPKCCDPTQPIDPELVNNLFDRDFRKAWNRKYYEFTTRNRVYCPKRGCGRWIKPERVKRDWNTGRKYADCSRCHTKACVLCSGKFHPASKECPKDDALKDFMKLGEKEGWRQCYSCKAMVELKYGCNHMTCRCGAEFCMVCAAKWKTCECTLFSDAAIMQDRIAHEQDPHAGAHVHGNNNGAGGGVDFGFNDWVRDLPGGWQDWGPEPHIIHRRVDDFDPIYEEIIVVGGDPDLPPPAYHPQPQPQHHHNHNHNQQQQQQQRRHPAPLPHRPHNNDDDDDDPILPPDLADLEAAFDAFDFQHPHALPSPAAAGWRTDFLNRANTVLRAPVNEERGREAEMLVRELRDRAREGAGHDIGNPAANDGGGGGRGGGRQQQQQGQQQQGQQQEGRRNLNVMDYLEEVLVPGEGRPGEEDRGGDEQRRDNEEEEDWEAAQRRRRRRASLMAGIDAGQRGGARVREWRRHVN